MKKYLISFIAALALIASFVAPVSAQTTVPTTTTSAAVTATVRTVILTSVTGVTVGGGVYVDNELMLVNTVNTTTRQVGVTRGYSGSGAAPHISGQTVYIGPVAGVTGSPFVQSDPPIGSCNLSAEVYSLRINTLNGRIWSCTASTAGQWVTVQDAYLWVAHGACQSSVSGNGTGTNGHTTAGTAPSLPVVQAQTSASGTNTHYFVCSLPVPTRTNAVKSAYIVDVTFMYGVQTTGLGTQVSTLASGTMNSATIFQYITYPVAAGSETATGLAEAARADTGILTITPAVASFNVATTTAGEFYAVKFTPSVPIAMATDRRQYFITIGLLNTATSATVTNSPGFYVHYRYVNAGF